MSQQIANLYEIDLNIQKKLRKGYLVIRNGISGKLRKNINTLKLVVKYFWLPCIIGLIYEQFNFPLSNSLKGGLKVYEIYRLWVM